MFQICAKNVHRSLEHKYVVVIFTYKEHKYSNYLDGGVYQDEYGVHQVDSQAMNNCLYLGVVW